MRRTDGPSSCVCTCVLPRQAHLPTHDVMVIEGGLPQVVILGCVSPRRWRSATCKIWGNITKCYGNVASVLTDSTSLAWSRLRAVLSLLENVVVGQTGRKSGLWLFHEGFKVAVIGAHGCIAYSGPPLMAFAVSSKYRSCLHLVHHGD